MASLMQPKAGEVFFLDTNIFVYALLASEPLKKQRALQLMELALASHLGCTSYQVIQEFANVATRKFAQRCTADECKQFIDAAMQPINRVGSSPELLHSALDLQLDTRYSFYDSLVLAAALQAGADVLYTEDLQHNQLVGGTLRIVNPFLLVANEAESGLVA
ncbi:MAG: PIN domain-containing protein [Rhodoferax sp.]|uniref:PIN domain-containing protein n=1 Tax=Rhodoferax sp. TaxID=50421 RepID=UPI002604A47D|nr:PIN domain-containing protein [Rhodoferax sp.]MDD5335558.1 PIN domain-containing protein [Rhodoferax sp.]